MQLPLLPHRGRIKPWASIPRIDWSNPLTNRLVFYGYDAGSCVINLALGGGIGIGVSGTSTTVPPAIGSSPIGRGYKYASGGNGIAMPLTVAPYAAGTLAAPFTIACMFFPTAAPGSNLAIVFGCNTATASTNPFDFETTSSGNTIVNYGWNNSAGATLTVPNYLNAAHTMCAVAPASAVNSNYYDGALNSSGVIATNVSGTGQWNFNCGQAQLHTPAFNTYNGFVYYGAYWMRALSASEVRKLHDDPWCFLIYPEDDVLAELVGAAGVIPPPANLGSTLPFMGVG